METVKKRISIVVPIYNEACNIKDLLAALRNVTRKIPFYEWQYVFVDDGSQDNSLLILEEECAIDPAIKVIVFSRNFGKEVAMTAGLESISASAVIFMDADLQHPPELIFRMVQEWDKGAEIVATIRNSVEGQSMLRRIGSWVFYALINRISDSQMMQKTTDFRLLDQKVVDVLRVFTERSRLVRGLIDWMGFKKVYVEFDAPDRTVGQSGYSYGKLLALAIGSLSSFSLFPLRLVGYIGLLISTVSGALLVYMLLNQWIFQWTYFTPLAMVVVGNTFLVGLVLCALGMLALYVGTIHTEVINRPLYILRRRINFDDSDKPC
jgi:polyisoprenyl-phosphate glycosyltransferase